MSHFIPLIFKMINLILLFKLLITSATFQNLEKHPYYAELASYPYGKSILDTVSLQLSSQQSPDEISKILENIQERLLNEQKKDNQLNSTRENECKAEIDFLDRPIEVMQSEIERAMQIQGEKQPLYNATIAKRDTKDQEIKFYEVQIVALDRKFKKDTERFQTSYQEHQEILNALNSSLEYMKKRHLEQQKVSVKSNKDHMEIIHIDILLQTESNQDDILRLIDISTSLKIDYEESMKNYLDRQLEEERDYEELRKSIEIILADLKEVREELNKHALELSDDLEEAIRMERESREENGSMERARADKVTECAAFAKQYLSEKQKRSEELQIIRDIQDMIIS